MAKITWTEQDVLQKRILRNRLTANRIRSGITALGKNLQVSATSNAVTVNIGSAYIEGSIFSLENDTTDFYILPLPSSETMAYRVVVRKEKEEGSANIPTGLYLKPGTESSVPTLERFNDGDREVYELSLAAVFKSEEGVIVVDERFDTSVCGLSEVELNGNELMDMMYPVGSIYMTANPLNPENLFGGTWERWGKGQVPVSVNEEDTDFATPDKEGGEKMHQLIEKEMASHQHVIMNSDSNKYIGWAGGVQPHSSEGATIGSTAGRGTTFVTQPGTGGGNQPHNNLQPYITCYMFKRIA